MGLMATVRPIQRSANMSIGRRLQGVGAMPARGGDQIGSGSTPSGIAAFSQASKRK